MRRRDPLAAAAVALAVVAFAGSFTHVQEVVSGHGQTGWLSWAIAAMPEVSVLLAVLKVRRARTSGEATGWAWITGVTAAGFTVSANLATAEHSGWGYVAAAWPAWASIGAAGLIEMGGGRPEPAPTATPVPAPDMQAGEGIPGPVSRTGVRDSCLREPATLAGDAQDDELEPALEAGADPDPIPVVVQGDEQLDPVPEPVLEPALEPVVRPVAAARQRRPSTVTARAVKDAAPRRPLDDLRAELGAAIEAGDLPADPTAEAIRRHLQCSPARARALRGDPRRTQPA